ncbi:response regulator [Beggiatoa alba]|nr:response regulator [Beggiatoa alba]
MLEKETISIASGNIHYLTPQEAAARLMVSPVTLRHWALAGRLAFVTTPGGHRRFAEGEVARFAGQHYHAAATVNDVHRILIVDNDVQLAGFLVELLQGLPDSVVTEVAHDGFEAGQKLLVFHPHTVLLDLMMPGLKGFEVCRRIKQNPKTCDIRVMMMTGYHTPENVQNALAAGAETCLVKPIDKIKLFKAIMLGKSNVTDAFLEISS